MKTILHFKILIFNFLLVNFISIFSTATAQNVAVTDDDSYTAASSAMLDVKSISKGLLIPRLTTIQREAIDPAATGLMVFDSDKNTFYYYNGEEWLALPQVSSSTAVSDALFAVKNSLGDTIFAVYNDGVKVVVPYGTKGKVGGFAVSGRSPTKAGEEEYLLVTPDSTRVFVNEVDVKGKVGGFAVSGRSPTKSILKDYFVSTSDSTRIYVEESAKGTVGGFAVSGRSPGKTNPIKFLDLTPKNYFIGHNSGTKTTGLYNCFIGYEAGKSNLSGESNEFIGYNAGYSNTSGRHDVFIGPSAGYHNSSARYNTFIGIASGFYNSTSEYNTYLGCNSGYATISGSGNTYFGTNAGRLFEKGSNNTFIGLDCGEGGPLDSINHATTGISNYNTCLGVSAGNMLEGGDNNVYIGSYTGANNILGTGNVYIGYSAGSSLSSGDNMLYIANSSSIPLIFGNFSLGRIGLGTTTPSYKLDVVGDINITGNFKINGANIVTTTIVEGDLTASGPISLNATRKVIGGAATISIADATVSAKGAVRLSNAYDKFSEVVATTELALSSGLDTKVTGTGFSMGKIFLITGAEIVAPILGFDLYWDMVNDRIILTNNNTKAGLNCHYWYQTQQSGLTEGSIGVIEPENAIEIGHVTDKGIEIHYGDNTGMNYYSIWIHCFTDLDSHKPFIFGHYTMF